MKWRASDGPASSHAEAETGWQARLRGWLWAAFAIFIGPALYEAGRPSPAGVALAFGAIGIAIAHAILAWGWRFCAAFLVICLTVTFSMENLGVLTGFPFGHYHFVVGAGLPHIGSIPIIVGFLYFGMGYPSWVIAGVLLRHAGLQPDDRFRLAAIPIVASFVLVQWDVVMDPVSSTLGGAWIWHDGGGYFGVPLTNFLGWFLTVWIFFQAFALWQFSTRRTRQVQALEGRNIFWLLPIFSYCGAGLCHIAPLLTSPDGVVSDASGQRWRIHDMHETAVIVMMATMLATAALALLRWLDAARNG